jgi:hypothetical protein
MSKRRFEMFHYQQVLVRMRQGDSDRDIARSKTMGRRKAAQIREVAEARGWLATEAPLPDDATLRAVGHAAASATAHRHAPTSADH